MTRRLLVLLVVCSGVAVAQLNSQIPASQVVATISGRVVDAVTGKPIAGAAVTLQPAHKPQGSCGVSNFGDGQFLCEVFEPGDFHLAASYRGYSRAGFGMRAPDDAPQPFDLAAGEHATGVTLRMWRNGAVTGRVVDAAGDPIVGAIVTAIRRLPNRSGDSLIMVRATTTDDRGIYRVTDVIPGTYVIALTHGSPTGAPASPMFYPNVASYSAANVVVVTSGVDLADINFAEALRRTFTVSGRLLGRASAPPASYDSHTTSIRLLPADALDTPATLAVATNDVFAQGGGSGARDRQGAFSFANVPPGKYVVRIVDYPRLVGPNAVVSAAGIRLGSPSGPVPQVDTMWAETPVTVTDHDVTDVPVVLHAAARLSGRIVFDDPSAKQPPGDAPIIVVHADGRDDGDMPFGVSETDGTFRTVGVPPGRYVLIALPPIHALTGWRMTSAIVGGRDVGGATFDLGADNITDVVVTMRLQMSTLAGFVRDLAGAAQPDASLYIFPAEPSRWTRPPVPWMATLPIETRPNRRGEYSLDLPAGEYYAAAALDRLANWRTPESLAELAKTAKRISIAPGEKKTSDVFLQR